MAWRSGETRGEHGPCEAETGHFLSFFRPSACSYICLLSFDTPVGPCLGLYDFPRPRACLVSLETLRATAVVYLTHCGEIPGWACCRQKGEDLGVQEWRSLSFGHKNNYALSFFAKHLLKEEDDKHVEVSEDYICMISVCISTI